MLCAEFMVSACNRTLQEAPDVLNRVGVSIFHNIFALMVRDGLMLSVMVPDAPIGRPVVGVDGFGLVLGVLLNEVMQGLSVEAVDDLESSLAATLDDSNDNALVALVAFPESPLFATYPCLIYLNLAAQLRGVGFGHGVADAVAEIPSGLVRDSDGALDLIGRDTLLGLKHEVDGDEPFGKRKVAIVKDGPCRHRELVAA